MTAVSPRPDGPASVPSTLTVADLEAGRCTAEDLDAFVPQTRAEARVLAEARAALAKPTRRSRALQREAQRAGAKQLKRTPVKGSTTVMTRPRQAAALLALTGVLGAAQATSASGSGPAADVIAAQSTGLLSLVTPSAQPSAVSRDAARAALTEATPAAGASAPLDDVTTNAAEQDGRRTEANQAKMAVQGAAEAAAKAAEEAAAAAAAAEAAAAARVTATWPLVAPLTAPIVSGFGYRVHPVYGTVRLHEGEDFSIGCGAPIGAAAAGKVVESGWGGGYGNRVVIDHGTIDGHDMRTTYNHMTRRDVQVGDTVTTGEQVGLVGSTGTSTGCHLHFEVQRDGSPVDPAQYLP